MPNLEPEKVSQLIGGLSQQQTEKLADILAVMQKIADTEQEKVLPKNELLKKSEEIKISLPEKPKDFILKIVRSGEEKNCDRPKKVLIKLTNIKIFYSSCYTKINRNLTIKQAKIIVYKTIFLS
jgi:hypothetical protein